MKAGIWQAAAIALVGGGLVVIGGRFSSDPGSDSLAPPSSTPLASEPSTSVAQSSGTDLVLPTVTVWKTPQCGCCGDWVDHLREAGFPVQVNDRNDLSTVKREHQVAEHLQSCHTAIVDGYVLEGHVPAAEVARLLEERPSVVGLAVPGMPVGSPGMEMGDTREAYDVLTFDESGSTTVWASYD